MDLLLSLLLMPFALPLVLGFVSMCCCTASISCSGCSSGTAGTKFQLDITGVTNRSCTNCSSVFNTTIIFDRVGGCSKDTTYSCDSGGGNETIRIWEILRSLSPNITERRFQVLAGFSAPQEDGVDLTGDPADCSVMTSHFPTTGPNLTSCNWTAAQVDITPLYT
jgi:hypothetical protein